jgi:hypothetical protein
MRQASTSKVLAFFFGVCAATRGSPRYRDEVYVSVPFPRIQARLRRQTTVGSMSAMAMLCQL